MSFFDPAALPFAVALLLVVLLVGAEVLGALVGLLPSAMLDSALPDVDTDVDSGDVSGVDGPVPHAPGSFARFLSWLSIGKVPALIVLIVFLAAFGLIGLLLLSIANSLAGVSVPMILSVPVAAAAALFPTRWSGGLLGRIFKGAREVVPSADDFVGRVATVTGGRAKVGLPAEAKLSGGVGQTHYVRVEPETDGVFEPGSVVLLTRRVSSVYKAIPNPSNHLNVQ